MFALTKRHPNHLVPLRMRMMLRNWKGRVAMVSIFLLGELVSTYLIIIQVLVMHVMHGAEYPVMLRSECVNFCAFIFNIYIFSFKCKT